MLVTGGSGYLGRELLRRADSAVGTYLNSRLDGGVRLDVRSAPDVARAVAGHSAVVHTAYVQDDPQVIVDGSVNVATACVAAGARLVHVSTDVVFDGAFGRPYREEDPPAPVTDYGRAKLVAERAVARLVPDALVVRTSLIYGGPEPSRHERDALDGGTAFFTDELRSPVHVGDLAAALLELAGLEERGLLHVAGADSVSRYEFARLVVAARGGDPERVRSASFRSLGLDRPADCTLDSSRAQGVLTTRLRGVHEVLANAAS
ncbi:MAG: dTDP-4-dehydrorhamnose reductase [Thermoleophilales bacterium]|nr:dTDP-4-dehydrorhamnose reductase [Thermoleophilales bacterium]